MFIPNLPQHFFQGVKSAAELRTIGNAPLTKLCYEGTWHEIHKSAVGVLISRYKLCIQRCTPVMIVITTLLLVHMRREATFLSWRQWVASQIDPTVERQTRPKSPLELCHQSFSTALFYWPSAPWWANLGLWFALQGAQSEVHELEWMPMLGLAWLLVSDGVLVLLLHTTI